MHSVMKGRAHASSGPDLRRSTFVCGLAAAGLTAQILIAHRLGGRDTSVWLASAWAAATTLSWAVAAAVTLVPARLAFDRIARGLPRWTALLVVAIGCVVLAAGLRATIDPVLPFGGQPDAPSIGDLFRRYVIRWSGPGMLVGLAVVSLPWLTARFDTTSGGAAGAASEVPIEPHGHVGIEAPAIAPEPLEALVVRVGERSVRVTLADVQWIGASGNYAELHGIRSRHLARITMAELEQRLEARRFVRVHRSAIVALDAIREVRRHGASHEVVLADGQVLPLSRVGRKALEARLGQRS